MAKQLTAIEQNQYAMVSELDKEVHALEKRCDEVWDMLKSHRNQAHSDASAGKNAVG